LSKWSDERAYETADEIESNNRHLELDEYVEFLQELITILKDRLLDSERDLRRKENE
jgi:hypothetical protein